MRVPGILATVFRNAQLKDPDRIQEAASPVYGEAGVTLRFRTSDLLWRPVGILVRFVAVDHPRRGPILLMSTDLDQTPVDIIRIYGLRFKIEVSFTQALHVIGAYAYHFWMAALKSLRRVSGNQHLHRELDEYRHAVRRKIYAYHRHIQNGALEGMNNKVKLVSHRSHGFRNDDRYIEAIYHNCAGLPLPPES